MSLDELYSQEDSCDYEWAGLGYDATSSSSDEYSTANIHLTTHCEAH